MIIDTDSPYSMEDDLPFEVGGLVYTSVWQWVVCDSALAANDVLCFIAARKGHHGVLDGHKISKYAYMNMIYQSFLKGFFFI